MSDAPEVNGAGSGDFNAITMDHGRRPIVGQQNASYPNVSSLLEVSRGGVRVTAIIGIDVDRLQDRLEIVIGDFDGDTNLLTIFVTSI